MGGLFRDPITGALVDSNGSPVLGRPRLSVRSPVAEQLLSQFGNVLSRHSRPLTPREIELCKAIFGASIDYEVVRVVTAQLMSSPTTLGNYVRIESSAQFDDVILVHELTHVWQYQTMGTRYMSDSLCAQIMAIAEHGDRNEAYTVYPQQLARVESFYDLSAERQARVVEFYFVSMLMRHGDSAERARGRSLAIRRGLLVQMTDPAKDNSRFEAEFTELERLVSQVKRARPLGHVAIYTEALNRTGARSSSPAWDEATDPLIMPLFRIDF